MERYMNMSEATLANITDEQFAMLVDIECMYNGKIISVDKPTYQVEPTVPVGEIDVYEVAGYNFTDPKEAEKVAQIINSSTSRVRLDYDYKVGYEYRYIETEEDTSVKVVAKNVYSKDTFSYLSGILTNITEIRDSNKKAKKEYAARCYERNEIAEKISKAVSEARSREYRLKVACNVYTKYLELCNGDKEIADKFFKQSEYSDLFDKITKKTEEE